MITNEIRNDYDQTFHPKKKYILSTGQTGGDPNPNSEFNSINLGIEINKRSKFLT